MRRIALLMIFLTSPLHAAEIIWARVINEQIWINGRGIAATAKLDGEALKPAALKVRPHQYAGYVAVFDKPADLTPGDHKLEIGDQSVELKIADPRKDVTPTRVGVDRWLVSSTGRVADVELEGQLSVTAPGVLLERVTVVNKQWDRPALFIAGCADLECRDCMFVGDRPVDSQQHWWTPRVSYYGCLFVGRGMFSVGAGRCLGEHGAMLFSTFDNLNRPMTLSFRQGPLDGLLVMGNDSGCRGWQRWTNNGDGMVVENTIDDCTVAGCVDCVVSVDLESVDHPEDKNIYSPGMIVADSSGQWGKIQVVGRPLNGKVAMVLDRPIRLERGQTVYVGNLVMRATFLCNQVSGTRFGFTLWGASIGTRFLWNEIASTVDVPIVLLERPTSGAAFHIDFQTSRNIWHDLSSSPFIWRTSGGSDSSKVVWGREF